MAKLRAAIIGGGRIGMGWNWPSTPYPYTHVDTYRRVADRVELIALCEPDVERARWAQAKHRIDCVTGDISYVLDKIKPDIVSVCVPEIAQAALLSILSATSIRGIWCEKPYMGRLFGIPTQVNYIRRFDIRHHLFSRKELPDAELCVIGKPDMTTACHFVDLCKFWRIPLDRLRWSASDGPCSYVLRFKEDSTGKGAEHREVYFPNGGVSGGFMKSALVNLLDVVEGKPGAELISPADPGITQATRDYLARLGIDGSRPVANETAGPLRGDPDAGSAS